MTTQNGTTLAARWAPIIDGWDAIDNADQNAGTSWRQDGRFSQIGPDMDPDATDALDVSGTGQKIAFRDGSALVQSGGCWVESAVADELS